MVNKGTDRKDVISAFGRVMMSEKDLTRVKALVCEGAMYLMGFESASLFRSDEQDKDTNIDTDVIKRAIAQKRVAFDEDYLAVPLFFSEKEVGWVLLAKGVAVEIEEDLLNAFRINAGLALENAAYFKKELAARETAIKVLVQALEERDPYTKGHSVKVAKFSKFIAEKLDDTKIQQETTVDKEEFMEIIYLAGILHDVGKIGIREDILLKEGPLDSNEWLEMKLHPYSSKEIIGVGDERLESIAAIILHHHERYNGSGYPYGLKEKEIPLGSRVLAVADSYDAMTSNRAYRQAMPTEMALAEIMTLSSGSNLLYDKDVCEAFFNAVIARPHEFGIVNNGNELGTLVEQVYDNKNRLLTKGYITNLLEKTLNEIKNKSERTVSIILFSIDENMSEDNRFTLLQQIKGTLPKSVMVGNYSKDKYVILLPDERLKCAYIKAELIKENKYRIKDHDENEFGFRNIKDINFGIYEPLSSDKDRGLKPVDVFEKVESAYQKALETKKIIICRQ
ncbi:HD-GYP domain-containing protein [bacterium]|nr:HD-GYP domain-containing protein [bacterium]